VIDVAFAPFSPRKTECQYVRDVPIRQEENGSGFLLTISWIK
jgi:hypothetical protein